MTTKTAPAPAPAELVTVELKATVRADYAQIVRTRLDRVLREDLAEVTGFATITFTMPDAHHVERYGDAVIADAILEEALAAARAGASNPDLKA